jgi:hypothetical protein
MFNRKLETSQRLDAAEELFGKEEPGPWTQRTAAVQESPAAANTQNPQEEEALVRRSYRILRGRIEHLRSLTVMNRQRQRRVIPWNYFGGASMDLPGELVLTFDGPEGSSTVTVHGDGLDKELLPGVEANRVEYIHELDDITAADVRRKFPGEPVVTGIHIAGGKREWNRGGAPGKGGRQP